MNKLFKEFCNKKLEHPDYYSEITIKMIKSPITVLLGPNGTGKSMSIKTIKYQLDKQNKQCVMYSTTNIDIVKTSAPACGDWDIYGLSCAFHSEGERMCDSFFKWCNSDMLQAIMTNTDPVYIIIDEADSGLSFDRLMESILQLMTIIKMEHNKGRDIHLVITCNSYEMYECLQSDITDVIWVPTKQHIKITSYYNFKKRYIEYYDAVHRKRMEDE